MYDIRQFKPSLYVLLAMGMTGFALAAQSPGVWVLSLTAILLNAWLVYTGRFWPLPRLIANLVTLIGTLYAITVFRRSGAPVILVIGQFLVLLQLVKLFEQRGNRDSAQLLILSLLLMVAASINTASLIFGILLVAYLFLSLYCCLLFHLKVETDHARVAIGVPEDQLNPMTLRQDQRYLARSMRRLTALVSTAAISTAVVVFLFFPRNTGSGLLGPLQFKMAQTLTGFSERVDFQRVAEITQNTQRVAYVGLWHNGDEVQGTQPIMLRGVTLDIYTGDDPSSEPWQWVRSESAGNRVFDLDQLRGPLTLDPSTPQGEWRQEIELLPSGSEYIFAMGGITDITPVRQLDGKLIFQRRDQSMRSDVTADRRVEYKANSTGHVYARVLPRRNDFNEDQPVNPRTRDEARLTRSVIDPKIAEYARREDVSGSDATGPLAARRPKEAAVTPLDAEMAENIERYLRSDGGFSYTLDLTDTKRIGDRDPMATFLYDTKRGHCQYFAGAMALMCQSLGLQARMVIGFRVDGADYNSLIHRYVVQQNHAHAWVEVLNDKGEWLTFDPTTGRDAPANGQQSMWDRIQRWFEYVEYSWANSVVAYDQEARSNLIQNAESKLNDATTSGASAFKRLTDQVRAWFADPPTYWKFSSKLLSILITALFLSMLGAVLWFLFERWRIRRRARRIGLDMLPAEAQLRLARQLGFYDDLLQLLARHDIRCPANLTPLEFSRSISFLPHEMFDAVHRMTAIFYQVRYGTAQLTTAQQRHLKNVINRIQAGLESR